ncbi:SRPBCC family protein [Streptomyces sp. ISL-10]|uniref:SRPBCC domain-containing protein n=1 Tax=Streptomyces sp. ISL-10 TaxID=2819172 RepID=UPI001BE990C7|nr:SRPBCC domain-containing protein [Streptomyces sp. ISL-10]MBT2368092.1 SRPBCC family protein [Streptomyces sp. ISL-10]
MEHEVFVPVPAETLRQVLRDPARVARCIPGLQQDADESAEPLSGRLKVRVGSHTITYRGTLRLVEQGRTFAVEGEGGEARGSGSVKIALTIGPEPTDGGTTLTFSGSSTADGRLADLEASGRTSAAHRLLDRFAEALAAAAFDAPPVSSQETSDDASGKASEDASNEGARAGSSAADVSASDVSAAGAAPVEADDVEASGSPDSAAPGDEAPSVFDAPVPPPSLGPAAEEEFAGLDASGNDNDNDDDLDDIEDLDALDDIEGLDELSGMPGEPAAEAAHARRTMIGRSAEEVDHAPPRGRYAPTPGPDAAGSGATLRWIAPAAALAVASAVVIGRVLRRRR